MTRLNYKTPSQSRWN